MSGPLRETIKTLEGLVAQEHHEADKLKWLINEMCALAGMCKRYPEVMNLELTEKEKGETT